MMRRLLLAGSLALLSAPTFADSTINALSAGTALGGTEQIPMFQTANPAVTTTPSAIKTYITGSALNLSAGAVNAPSLTLGGDTTTGLYRPGADQLAFAAAGSLVFDYGASAASTWTFNTNFRSNGGLIYWVNGVVMSSPADGVLKLTNNAQTDFTSLKLGGTTSSFPAIKRSSAVLAFRLADDSADADITLRNATYGGSPPTHTGTCATTQFSGGNTVGTFQAAACSATTVILTFATTAPTGWACASKDRTTTADANLVNQTATAQTTATFVATTASSDVIQFSCQAY